MEFRLVYSTVKDRNEAQKIGKILIEEGLAACVNIIDNIESIYRWDNKICADSEVLLLAKTVSSKTKKVISRITSLHSYEIPCITVLPIFEGHLPFLEWIKNETNQ